MDEKETLVTEDLQTAQDSQLKKQFTTVTPLSKYLALALFVALPFIGFWFGFNYQGNDVNSEELVTSDELFEDVGQMPVVDQNIETLEPKAEEIPPINLLTEGELFYFSFYGEVPSASCTEGKNYLDCISSQGLVPGYRLPAEFDRGSESELFIDYCNFGYRTGEQVGVLYCEGSYTKVFPKKINEGGLIEAQRQSDTYNCTFAIESLSVTREDEEYTVLEGKILNPSCTPA